MTEPDSGEIADEIISKLKERDQEAREPVDPVSKGEMYKAMGTFTGANVLIILLGFGGMFAIHSQQPHHGAVAENRYILDLKQIQAGIVSNRSHIEENAKAYFEISQKLNILEDNVRRLVDLAENE
ncbi:MAG: hypothetical protein ACE5IR_27785 [bacterium]